MDFSGQKLVVRGFPLRLAGLVGFAGLLIACSAATAAVSPASAATQPHWSSAKLVPGVGGDWSEPFAVSCTGPGDCTAGGEYGPDEPYTQSLPFVATEAGGKWDSATSVTGIPTLGGVQYAAVTSVSCAWPGNCAAVGYYLPSTANDTGQAFVVDQVNGTWQRAHPLAGVTGSVNENAFGVGWTITASCAPATTSAARKSGLDCLAVGGASSGGHDRGFVVGAKDGTWGAGQLVTGLARVGGTRPSQVNTVSCPAAGTCAIGGYYTDSKGHQQAFVANEASGTWHSALEVPGTSALNVKGSAQVDAVSCPVARDCTAAGDYLSKSGAAEFFVVYETAGTWRSAIEVLGLARLGIGADLAGPVFAGVSCTVTTCEVGGTMNTNRGGGRVGVLVGEVGGRWGSPHPVPGTDSVVTSLSCPAAGDCAAGGTVGSPGVSIHGIVLDQVNEIWSKPVTVAPSVWSMTGEVTALSCAAARNCAAVGFLPEGWGGGPSAAVATEASS
jgi:hypothetical protein